MPRCHVILRVVLAGWCVCGCARSRHVDVGDGTFVSDSSGDAVDPFGRKIDKELATIAADVRQGLQQRLEADEPLTPQFILLLSDWSSRVFVHRWMAATSAAERDEAGKEYWRQSENVYRITWPDYDPNIVLLGVPVAEYALREAEQILVEMGSRTQVQGEGSAQAHTGRPLSEIARAAWGIVQSRSNEGEPLTPEWVELACEVSRQLWLAEWLDAPSNEAARRGAAGPATGRHIERLTGLMNRLRSVDISDGPASQNAIRYYVAEAKFVGSGNWRDDENAPVMADGARAQVEWLWKRKAAGEPPDPQFVQQLCVWSERLMSAEQRSGDVQAARDAAARHLRRMRDLHADLKKQLDAGGDVGRIQVCQAAYFLRDVESYGAAAATRPARRGGFYGAGRFAAGPAFP